MTRALVAGVGSFDRPAPTAGPAAPAPAGAAVSLRPLPAVAPAVRELASAFARGRVEVGEALIDCTSAEFEAAWQHLGLASGAGEPLVVHFAGHGVVSRVSRNLFLATSDIQDLGASLHTTAVRVNNLIAAAVDSGRPVLLLLDVCGAGRAVEEERLLNLLARRSQDADPRVWIIGASASDALAFGARFTTAAAQVLHSLADGDLDISRREEYVPFLTLARAIHSRLGSLGTGEGRYDQDVTHSPLALAAPETPPFFRNPGYDPVARADRLPGLHPALRGLAEACTRGVDPLHFGDRVAGGRSAQTVLFSGRTAQLARIQRWITVGARRLLVVTGGPGSGKSALLGVTACLLHPELEAIGDRVAAVVDDFYPRRPATVLAVHARQLTLDQITDSLGRQLRAQRAGGAGSARQSTVQALRTGSAPGDATAGLLDDLAAAGDVLVVLDALDEAVDPASVLDEFLLPLVTGADTRGCKLLLGTRPWWDVLPALRRYLDAHPGSVLDLDPADADDRRALAADLDGYLRGLLRPRDLDARERVRSIARRLADYTDHGAFLVAAVYAEHLRGTPAAEAAEPPCDVTEVFDLHIATLAATDPWIRPVLDVLGRARGQGIPLDLVHAAALAHHPPGANTPRPQLADTRRVLGKAAFYTRTAADTDQRVLYRYFHQVLADHTASRGDPAVFYEALLSTVPAGEDGALNWTYAHPYLLRHAADHAAEAGPDAVLRLLRSPAFLGASDLERLLPHVLHRFDGGGPLSAYAQIVGHGARRAALLDDRSGQSALLGLTALHLGFDASHLGLEGSGEEFADRRPRALRSTWATSTTPRLASLPVQPRPVVSLDAATIHDPDGVAHEVIATVCADGTVTFWDARTTTSFGQVDMGEDRPVGVRLGGPVDAEVTVLDASFRIWRGGMWNGRLRRTAGAFPPPERQGRTWMTRAVEGRAPGRLHVVWGRAEEEYETRLAELDLGDDGVLVSSSTMGGSPLLRGNSDIGLWPCGGGRLPLDPAADPAEDVPVVAVTNPLMGEIRLYDVEEGTLVGRVPLDGYEAVTHCRTLLCGRLDGAPVAVTGDHMGRISIWSVASYEDGVITYAPSPAHSFTGHFLAVKDLAIATVGDREVLLSGGDDGAVHLWNVRQFRDALRPTPFAGAITGLTVARLPSPDAAGPRDLVLAGDTSGNWSVSDVGSGLRAHAMPPRRQGEVTGVAVAELPVAGTSRLLGVVCSTDQSIRLVDLETGEAVGTPFGGIVESMGTRCEWTAVTAGSLAGRKVVVGAATGHYRRHRYNTLYVYAAEDWSDTAAREMLSEPLFGPFSAHRGPVPCVALGTVEGRDILVTGSFDGHVRVWDGHTFERATEPLETGSAPVLDLWLGRLLDREVVLAVCGDGTLRRWDARTFESLGEPVAAHDGEARGVSVADGADGPVVVTTGLDGLVRTWDPATWSAYGPGHPLLHPGTALDCAGPTVLVASGVTLVRLDLDAPPAP